ncbi:unnamed protein product [Caenorhabditis auriculariae]|uniref:MADF domain-containing protein n=1 Tax=Caenorhabditis auriculariae TaxID=2777116 RepID=A0A8S1HUU0_9PELO|nr:unnamed protein product [Caenorhabditis auriculariae]
MKEINALFGGRGVRMDETPAFNIRLIAEVKSRPYLYDHTDEGYNLITWRNNAWTEIAESLESTPEHVKTRWKTLRDRFKKEEKKERQAKKASTWVFQRPLRFIQAHVRDRITDDYDGGIEEKSAEGQVSPMEVAINFIESEIIKNNAESSASPSETSSSTVKAEPSEAPPAIVPPPPPALTHPPPPKRARVSLTDQSLPLLGRPGMNSLWGQWNRLEDEEDEIFGQLIAMKLSKLDNRTKELAKMEVLKVIFEAQYGSVNKTS